MNRRPLIQVALLLLLLAATWQVWKSAFPPPPAPSATPASRPVAVAPGANRPARANPASVPALLERAGRQEAMALLQQRLVRANARPNEAVLQFRDDDAFRAFLARAPSAGLTVLGRLDGLLAARIRYDSADSVLDELLANTGAYAEVSPNFLLRAPQVPPKDSRAAITEVPVGNALLGLLGATEAGSWGRGVTVAVLDSGIATDATFLPGQVRFLDLGLGLAPGSGPGDGHGTAVAALVAGNGAGAQGVAGAASLLGIRVTDEAGLSDIFTLSQGILAAVDAGARVINVSLGGYDTNAVLSSAIGRATDAGAVIVASAGNDQLAGLTWPAADPRVVSVGAVDGAGQPVTFSNSGPQLSLSAPGYGVPTAWLDDQRILMDGTSASAPLVAGTIAAVLSLNPTLSGTEAATIVREHANDAGEAGNDADYGSGILNAGWTMSRADPAYADPAIASTLYDATTGTMSVLVQNRGNQPVSGLQVRVALGGEPRTLDLGTLASGATATLPIPVDQAALRSEGRLSLDVLLANPPGLTDRVPGNNRARGAITAPAAQ